MLVLESPKAALISVLINERGVNGFERKKQQDYQTNGLTGK